jgi:hypothetical protein
MDLWSVGFATEPRTALDTTDIVTYQAKMLHYDSIRYKMIGLVFHLIYLLPAGEVSLLRVLPAHHSQPDQVQPNSIAY